MTTPPHHDILSRHRLRRYALLTKLVYPFSKSSSLKHEMAVMDAHQCASMAWAWALHDFVNEWHGGSELFSPVQRAQWTDSVLSWDPVISSDVSHETTPLIQVRSIAEIKVTYCKCHAQSELQFLKEVGCSIREFMPDSFAARSPDLCPSSVGLDAICIFQSGPHDLPLCS